MTIRTFIALEIPQDIIEIAFKKLKSKIKSFDKINWEPKEKLHLTLKFIGNFEENNINLLTEELNKTFERFNKLDLGLDKFGFFWKDENPKILWLGLKENKNLFELVSKIDEVTNQFGIEKEKRKFKSHITFLRIKNLNHIDELLFLKEVKFDNINFVSDKIHLFKSELLKTGSVYKSLKEFQLK
ncbi:MAG: RNA 2',3'-cyclic phosphodiesterase [Melioribacteraceae bacterium]|nr:RNA 2',3'-cyclic phosphodiesterase [Melioribacteraceae bacterium]